MKTNKTTPAQPVDLTRLVRRRWKPGLPPKDGGKYEARRRFWVAGKSVKGANAYRTAAWSSHCWWNGKSFVSRNQFLGGERWIDLGPCAGQITEWRESPNAKLCDPAP